MATLATSRPRRAWRSMLTFGTVILFTAVTALTALATTPLLIGWLAPDRFGAYRAVNDWYGYLTLLDFGLGGALAPLLARALGRDDPRAVREALAAGMRAYLALTLLILGVGLAMTPLVAWQVKVGPALVDDLRRAWLVGLLSFLPLALAPLRTLAEARQRGYRVNLMMTAQCLLITALSLAFARSGWGIAGQALAFSIGTASFYAMLAWDAARDGPVPLGPALLAAPDPATWRALWALSVPMLLINFSGRVSLLTDNIITGGILGAAAVTSLVVTQRLATLALAVLQAVGSASWAALAELHAQGDRDTFNRRLIELSGLVTLLGIAIMGPIVAYNRHFVALWIPEEFPGIYGGDLVIVVAAANGLVLSLTSLWGWCFAGTGHASRLVVPFLVSAAINLAASILLTHRLGIVGPLLGTSAAFLTVNAWSLPLLMRRTFGTPLRRLAGAVAVPLAWGLPYAAGLWWVAHAHRPPGWWGLAVEMALAGSGFLALAYAVILGPADRAAWRHRLMGVRPGAGGGAP